MDVLGVCDTNPAELCCIQKVMFLKFDGDYFCLSFWKNNISILISL